MTATTHLVLETVFVLMAEREVDARGGAARQFTREPNAEAALSTKTVLWSIADERRTAELTAGVGAFDTARPKFT